MPGAHTDPARLKGEALNRWYRRTPEEVEAERRAAEEQRYRDFFEKSQPAPEAEHPARPSTPDPDILWVASGSGGYRAVRPGGSDFMSTLEPDGTSSAADHLPEHAAAPERGQFREVGNPHNPRLRREWEIANGRPWPRTPEGVPYDVAHIRAIADGGTNTLDNIRPMEAAEHRASHREDAKRYGKRAGIARAFGGTVEPPAHAPRRPKVRSFGAWGLVPNILGILNGRIRTDTPVHMWNDMLGYSSEDDLPREDLIA